MRLKDVDAAELTDLVGIAGVTVDAAGRALPTGQGADEPLLLTQEVPFDLVASEFDPDPEASRAEKPFRGVRALLHVQWVRWAEKRHAQRTTRAVVARFRGIVARYPALPTRDALCLLVMEHRGCDVVSARRVLANAENSFSTWPADRDLNLVDVAHYLSVSEFLALHRRERGIRGDIGQLVSALVPRELLYRPRV